MARHLAGGTTEYIRLAKANSLFLPPFTVAAITLRGANAADHTLYTAGQTATLWNFGPASSNVLRFWNGTSTADSALTFTVADGWSLIGCSKDTGTVAPRFHKYTYAGNSWTHQNSGTSVANYSVSSSEGPSLGYIANSYNGELALVGLWNVILTDAQVECLPFSLASWFQVNPMGLWLLDQASTSQKVLDLSGNGSHENGISGTSVSTSSVPVFSYGLPSQHVAKQPAAGVGGAAGPRDLLLLRAG